MHTQYLGENSSEYKSLIRNNIFNNELEEFKIINDNGSFTGFKVKKDDKEGYAYFNHKGDFYEFAEAADCTVSSLKKHLIAEKTMVNHNAYSTALLNSRDYATKSIQNYEIEFTNSDLLPEVVVASRIILDGVEGFVFNRTEKHTSLEDLDRNTNVFVEKKLVNILGKMNSFTVNSNEELDIIRAKKIKEQYSKTVDFSEKNNIKFLHFPNEKNYIEHNGANIDYLINRLKGFSGNAESNLFNQTYSDLSHLSNEIKKETLNNKTIAAVNANVDNYGFYVEAQEDYANNIFSLDIKDSQNKKLSSIIVSHFHFEVDQKLNDLTLPSVEFTLLDLSNELNLEDKKVQVFENGEFISLNQSKFKDIYETFNKFAFTTSEDAVEYKLDYVKDNDGNESEAVFLDLRNKFSANLFMTSMIESIPSIASQFSTKNISKLKI